MNPLPFRFAAADRRDASRSLRLSLLAAAALLTLSPALQAQTAAPATRTLETVVVTASGFEQDIKQAPASITVITREELEKKAFRDLTDVMRDVEGAAVTGIAAQQGGGGNDIALRGMPAAYTLILVDGKRINTREARTNGNGGYEAGWVPPVEAIERIEIIRGPMSSLYGSDAMGGVVNVITRKVSKSWTGSLRAEGTFQEDSRSGNSLGTNFYLSGPIKQDLLGLSIYGGYLDRDEDEIANGFNGAENYNLNGRLALTPNKNHDIVLDFGRTRQDSSWLRGRSVDATTASTESVNERDNYSLTHTGRWGRLGTSTVSVYGEKAFRSNYNLETNADPGAPNVVRNTVIDGKWTLPIASHLVTVGGQRRKEDFTASNYVARVCRNVAPFAGCPVGTPNNGTYYQAVTVANAQLSTTTDALFVEDEWSITDKLTLTGGLRLDDHEVFGKEWTPRAYTVYHLTPDWTVKGGVSKGYKAPSARDILPGYALSSGGGNGGGSVVIRSNPQLKPETTINQEVGLQFSTEANPVSGGVTLFNNEFKDRITEVGVPGATDPNFPGATIRTRVNLAEAVTRGLEANLKWALSKQFSARGTYTYIRSKVTSDPVNGQEGLQLTNTPKQALSATLEWDPNDRLSAWTRLLMLDKQSRLNRTSAVPVNSPGYSQLDFGGSYKLTRATTLHAAIYNVGDKRLDYDSANQYIDGRRLWVAVNTSF